ncbi:MAG TPA: hypothetical protein PLF32_02600 [Bacteroidales bacterium]|nr:hypothetical protein [Bacteroidales bacterium]HON19965.1 hypothetical protein [Bacteroidales bacterium]HOR81528.1 hypothetical protein [Bacteroidales bacterium]HPJ90394.1 hypothetical protein [Bacteroidales bacterium]
MNNKIRQILTIVFILTFEFAFGQNFSYPTINSQGKDVESFIPKDWTLLDSVQGDLNKDNCKDLVLVIQHKDSVQLDENSELTQPRMLLILFYNKAKNLYNLAEKSESFILPHDDSYMTDPYVGMSISNKGVLTIEFEFFATMGSYGSSTSSYKFRYQNNEFALIGADDYYVHRATGEFGERSFNFLTKKLKVTEGHIDSDKKKVVWRDLDIKELKTLKTFKRPFTWEIEKNSYI